MTKTIRPPVLRPGDTIGIMAPSSRTDKDAVAAGKAGLEKRGYKVFVHPQTYKQAAQSAGYARDKARALHDLFKNDDISAIIAARGGNRAGTILEHLDMKLIRQHPKILMGYSDVTTLLNAITVETGLVTFHGPVLGDFRGVHNPTGRSLKQALDILTGTTTDIPLGARCKIMRPGRVRGTLIGGNLSLIVSLLGTPWQPRFKNTLLFLEDCHEEYSRIDRMILHLRLAGVFDEISGLICGTFTDMTDTGRQPFGLSLADIIRQHTAGYRFPVVMNAAFGHGRHRPALPVGAVAALQARTGNSRLTLDAPAVAR